MAVLGVLLMIQYYSNFLFFMEDSRIPVTILTGFLGSGKTTLLNELIKQNPQKKFAVKVHRKTDFF